LPILAAAAWLAAAPAAFKPPATAAERALDQTLRRADDDDNARMRLVQGRASAFDRLLTPALIADLRRQARALVQAQCGGRYREGQLCGFDYNPLTCAQDNPARRLYRSARAAAAVTLQTRWAGPGDGPISTYRMTRQAEVWRIDAIRCASGETVNWR
jgi:hypothetical protein